MMTLKDNEFATSYSKPFLISTHFRHCLEHPGTSCLALALEV